MLRRPAKLADHLIDGRGNGRLQLPQAVGVGPRTRRMRESTSSPKRVCGFILASDGQVAARIGVQQRGGQRGRADVDRHGISSPLGVAGLEVQQPAVGQDRRAAKARLAADAAAGRGAIPDRLPADRWPFPAAAGRRRRRRAPAGQARRSVCARPDRPRRPRSPRTCTRICCARPRQRRAGEPARSSGLSTGALTRQPAAGVQFLGGEELPFRGRGLAAAVDDDTRHLPQSRLRRRTASPARCRPWRPPPAASSRGRT